VNAPVSTGAVAGSLDLRDIDPAQAAGLGQFFQYGSNDAEEAATGIRVIGWRSG
jgi:hypothetical protein